MKKGFFKTFAAIATAAVMTLGASAAAMAGPSGQNTRGDAEFFSPIYQVNVPTTLPFAVNTVGAATQSEFKISNSTEAPVLVSLNLTVVKDETVTIVTPGEIDFDDPSNTDRDIYIALMGAEGITSGTATSPGEIKNVKWDFATKGELTPNKDNTGYATGAELEVFAASAGEYSSYIGFVLGAAVHDDDGFDAFSTGSTGYAAFTVYSEANPYATWSVSGEPSVLSVTGAFTFTGLAGTTYSRILANNVNGFVPTGVNQVTVDAAKRPQAYVGAPVFDAPGFIVDEATVTALTTPVAVTRGDTNVEIPFFADGETLTRLAMRVTSTSDITASSSARIDGNNLVFDSSVFSTTGSRQLGATLSNGTTYNFSINITN